MNPAGNRIVPTAYEEGVEMGRDLYRQGISLHSLLPLSAAARRLGYRKDKDIRAWVRGVVKGYSEAKEKAHG